METSSRFFHDFDKRQHNTTSQWLDDDALHKKGISIKDFFSKCDQIRRNLRIWSHLLKKS